MQGPRKGARRMRRVMAAAALVAVAGTVAACGGGESTESSGSTGASGGDKKTENLSVAYLDGSCANSWRVMVRAELEDEVKKHPEIGKFEYACAQGDLSKAMSQIRAFIAQDVDILMLFPDWGKPLLPVIRQAHQKGITVVPFLTPMGGKPGQDYTAVLNDDFDRFGAKIADYFIEKLNGKGNVVWIGGFANNDWDGAWINGFETRLKAAGPGVKLIDKGWGDWEPAKSARVMATLLQKHGTIDGVVSIEASTVKPEVDQYLAAGKEPGVWFSWDVNGMMRDYLELKPKHPKLEWGFGSARTWGVRDALDIALRAQRGEKVEPEGWIKNEIQDCSDVCKDLYEPNMPDGYAPTSKAPLEDLKKALGS
jgi:ribose transport system substrate-binding protein